MRTHHRGRCAALAGYFCNHGDHRENRQMEGSLDVTFRSHRCVLHFEQENKAESHCQASGEASSTKNDFFGKEGLSGTLAGSRTWNCSACWLSSRFMAMADWSLFFSKSLQKS